MPGKPYKIPKKVYLVTAAAVIGGFLFGYDTAVISGTIGALDANFVIPMGLPTATANWWLGFTVSAALIGCIVGAMGGGFLGDRFGRKKVMMLAAMLFLVSALGSAWPETGLASMGMPDRTVWIAFLCYRIVGGIGVGLASMLAPMYISEIAPAPVRGRLVSYNQFAIVIGVFVSFLVNFAIAQMGDDNWLNATGWRLMFGAEALPALIYLLFLFGIPESPRWLVQQGREVDAKTVFGQVMPDEKNLEAVVLEVKASFGKSRAKLTAYGLPVLVMGVLLAVFQQFIGINVVLYYAPEIFKDIGLQGDQALWQSAIVGLVNMVFTIVAIKKVDRFGRKPLLIIGAIGMSLSMLFLGTAFYLRLQGASVLISMLAFIAFFAMSWGPVTWVLIAEIFPNKIRAGAMSLATATMWISNFAVSQTFPVLDKHPYLIEKFNHGFAYWTYGLVALAACCFVWLKVPETKGRSLEKIDGMWNPK